MTEALRPGFEVVTAQGQVVAAGLAGGEPVRVMPGSYAIRLKGQPGKTQTAVIKPQETTKVQF